MENYLGSLITHEHTLQMDKKEMETNKKKKKDCMHDEDNDDTFYEVITLLARGLKIHLKKIMRGFSSRREGEEKKNKKNRGKQIKRDLKFKENTK